VLFFDDDQIPPDDYLAKVVRSLHADYDGVGGPLSDKGGGLHTCKKCSLGDSTLGDEARMVDRLIGGNMALRVSAFKDAGFFDERLSGRGDETEWFKRASDLRFYYDPDLWVWHRRDSFSVRDLCSYAYRQGKATPVFESITGVGPSGRVQRAARYGAHALLHRCSHGLELFCREMGALSVRVRS
jgi:GT2 family glycosyltransferase